MAYGYQSDKNSAIILKSVFKRTEVMNIGIKDMNNEVKFKTQTTSVNTLVDEETEPSSPELKIIKKRSVHFKDDDSDLKTKPSDTTNSNVESLQDPKSYHSPKKTPNKDRSRAHRSRNYIMTSKTAKKKPTSLAEEEEEEIMAKKQVSFGSAYFHALKKCHNFTSIFLRNSKQISRPLRFFLYFLRFYGMLAVSSLFFTQRKVDCKYSYLTQGSWH
jgi:hypothetical protein